MSIIKKSNFMKIKNGFLSKFKSHIKTTKSNYIPQDLVFIIFKIKLGFIK